MRIMTIFSSVPRIGRRCIRTWEACSNMIKIVHEKRKGVCSWAKLANKHGVCSPKAQKLSKTHRKWDSPKKWYVPRKGNYNSSRRKVKLLIIVYANQTSSIYSPLCWEERNILTMTQINLKQRPRIQSKLHLHLSLLPLLFSETCLHDDTANNKVWQTTGTCSSFVPQHPSGTFGSEAPLPDPAVAGHFTLLAVSRSNYTHPCVFFCY